MPKNNKHMIYYFETNFVDSKTIVCRLNDCFAQSMILSVLKRVILHFVLIWFNYDVKYMRRDRK